MPPKPIYTPDNLHGRAYQLRYSWSAWPTRGTSFPDPPPDGLFERLAPQWETDGIRVLEQSWSPELIQLTVSVTPRVTPTLLTARLKGRLQHGLRQAGQTVTFSRKVSLRSLGDSTSTLVEQYIRNQVGEERFVDPRTEQKLSEFTVDHPDVDLSVPTATNSGRYWCNLHVVLVTEQRGRAFDSGWLSRIRDGCFAIAEKKGHLISVVSVMPDHVHLALRGNIDDSAEQIALGFLNNLEYRLGQSAVWQFGYYAGTFGEYDMWAVRRSDDG